MPPRAVPLAERPQQSGATDVSAVFVQLQELLSLMPKVDARTRPADFRFWAAARATPGLKLPLTGFKTGNWDQLFDQDQKNAVRA
jgi:hypothetical protein